MSNVVGRISSNRFIRNVLIVVTGTAGAQIITLGFAPVITRLYDPDAFGLLGIFMAILGIATPVAALTYPIAIVLPRSDEDARGLAALSARVALAMALILTVFILMFDHRIATLLKAQAITPFLLLVPFTMFFSALLQIMQQRLIRGKQFRVTAKVAISQSAIMNILKVGAGFYYPTGGVLIALATLGNVLYVLQLWFREENWKGKDLKERSPTKKHKVSLKEIASRYRDFPCYRAPQVLLNGISESIPVLVLASAFGPAVAGYYALSKSILSAPVFLVGSSVSSVFYPKVTEIMNEGKDAKKIFFKATLGLVAVIIPPFAVLVVMGPVLFAFVFGAQWTVAGEYAQWMALWLAFHLASRPTVTMIPALGIQKEYLVFEVFLIMLKVGAILLGSYHYRDPLLAVALYSVVSAVSFIVLFIIVIKQINQTRLA